MEALSLPTKLLIVDDDPAIRGMLATVLNEEGYAATTAEDGAEALLQLEAAPFALLMLDLSMPGVDGMEVLRRLGTIPEAPPAIVISARSEARLEVRTLGAAAFVPKPFDLDDLLGVVARVLKGSSVG